MYKGVLAVVCVLGACGRLQFEQALRTDGGDAVDVNDAASDGNVRFSRSTRLMASNAEPGDQFGLAVAISTDGSTIAVGAPLESSASRVIGAMENDNSAAEAGAVYVFRRGTSGWAQEAYIKASNADPLDQFGWSVALSADGNTLMAGARREDSGSVPNDNSVSNAGAAYVFTRTGTTWAQTAYLKASNPDASDAFGENVAISDDAQTVAAAAYYEDSAARSINGDAADDSASATGAVYVFTPVANVWGQQAYIKASNADADDELGRGLALSANGNVLIASAIREDGAGGAPTDNSLFNAGVVYAFARIVATWTQSAYIKPEVPGAGDNFGFDLALTPDGTMLAIGSSGESSAATGIDGDQADDSQFSSGAAYLFTGGPNWSQRSYIKASNTQDLDELGFAVALSASGDRIAVAAIGEDSASPGLDADQTDNSAARAGAVYAYAKTSAWMQQHYIKGESPGTDNNFGWTVALSGDGSVLVVSEPFAAGAAGAIYIYE